MFVRSMKYPIPISLVRWGYGYGYLSTVSYKWYQLPIKNMHFIFKEKTTPDNIVTAVSHYCDPWNKYISYLSHCCQTIITKLIHIICNFCLIYNYNHNYHNLQSYTSYSIQSTCWPTLLQLLLHMLSIYRKAKPLPLMMAHLTHSPTYHVIMMSALPRNPMERLLR